MQYITAKVNTTDNSIIETKISEPAGYVKQGDPNCQILNLNVSAGEYIKKIDTTIGTAQKNINYVKITTNQGKNAFKGIVPKKTTPLSTLMFN